MPEGTFPGRMSVGILEGIPGRISGGIPERILGQIPGGITRKFLEKSQEEFQEESLEDFL